MDIRPANSKFEEINQVACKNAAYVLPRGPRISQDTAVEVTIEEELGRGCIEVFLCFVTNHPQRSNCSLDVIFQKP